MTAGGSAGHGSGADLPPLLLGKNMPKTRAGGVEKASPESAERKGPSRPRAGGVSSARAWAGGAGRAAPGGLLCPPLPPGAGEPACGLSRGAAGPGPSGAPQIIQKSVNLKYSRTLSVFPCALLQTGTRLGIPSVPSSPSCSSVTGSWPEAACLSAFNSQWK